MKKLTKYLVASRAVNTYGTQSKIKQLINKLKGSLNNKWRNINEQKR